MATYTQLLYHITFSTKYRKRTLDAATRPQLLAYIWGFCKNKNCHLYRVNAVDDHLHLLVSIHQTIAVADFIRELKLATNHWNKECRAFPAFEAWQGGYAAFTHAFYDIERLTEYIKNQEEHHREVTFEEEFRKLVEEAGLDFDPRFLD